MIWTSNVIFIASDESQGKNPTLLSKEPLSLSKEQALDYIKGTESVNFTSGL